MYDTLLCDGTSVAINAGQAFYGEVVRDLGTGVNSQHVSRTPSPSNLGTMFCVVTAKTDLVAAVDGAVLTFNFYTHTSSTASAIASGTLLGTKAITVNTPVESSQKAGETLWIFALPDNVDYSRYIGIAGTVATQNISSGTINAFLTRDISSYGVA